MSLSPDDPRHGSRRGYDLGCRCWPCRIENHCYQQDWREGRPRRVGADVIRAHLKMLIDSGWTQVGIAEAAGVSRGLPWFVLAGRVQAVNSETADRLLAVEPLRGAITLAAGPLVEAIEHAAARAGGLIALIGDEALRRTFYRARKTGKVTERQADRLAVGALSRTLEELYGFDYEQASA